METKRKSHEEFVNEVYSLVANEYSVLGHYTLGSAKILMRHNICGHEWEVRAKNFTRKDGTRCPKCNKVDKLTLEVVKDRIKDLSDNAYEVLSDAFINVRTKIRLRHTTCGHEYEVLPRKFFEGSRCPLCNLANSSERATKRMAKYIKPDDQFIKEVKQLCGDEYTFLEPYTHRFNKIKCKHNTCGNEWDIRPNDFLSNHVRCPKCSYIDKKSRDENELINYVKSIYSGPIIESDRTVLERKELDLYILDKQLAIEFNGLYWHCDKFKDRKYHIEKTLECQKKGIQLIHVFEDEWVNKQEIVKSKIKHLLNINDNPVIYARKCYVIELDDSSLKNKFLNDNHIQGADKSCLNLALMYKDNGIETLVGIMTFAQLRKSLGQNSKEDCFELSRFATSINHRVIGGFGKLWTTFIRTYEFKEIITYADRRWSAGNVYEKSRFTLSHISRPNYWYVKNNNVRLHRYGFRKQNLKTLYPDIYDPAKTEFEIMNQSEYNRIWDCGNMVFKYNKL